MRNNDSFYITEAFGRLKCLDEEVFDLSVDSGKADELRSFVADDIEAPEEEKIIDVEAEKDYDLQDNYVGKVILECTCCHSRIYKDQDDVIIDEDTKLANKDEECPVCSGTFGYDVIGKIEPFEADRDIEVEADDIDDEEVEDDISDEEIEDAVHEALKSNCECAKKHKEDLEHSNLTEGCEECDDCEDVEEGCSKLDEEEAKDESLNEKIYSDDFDRMIQTISKKLGYSVDELMSMSDDDIQDLYDQCWINIKDEELDEEAEKFPNPDKHKKVGKHNGVDIYKCNDCGKFAAMVDGKKVKKDSKKDLEDVIDSVKESLKNSKLASDDSKKLDESINEVEVETKDGKVEVEKEDGKIKVEFKDDEDEVKESEGEEIVPLDNSEIAEIENNGKEDEPFDDIDANVEDDIGLDAAGEDAEVQPEDELEEPIEGEEEIDDFDEEGFENMGESFLTRVYDNVKSFKVNEVKENENKDLVVEGLITFESGKEAKTSFVFESRTSTKRGKTLLEGHNDMFSKSNKAFMLKGKLEENKFTCESLTYKYNASSINESNESESIKVYGRVVR